MSHNLKSNVENMQREIKYQVMSLVDYLLEEIKNLQEENAAQSETIINKVDIIVGQKKILARQRNLIDSMKRVAA